MKQAVKDVLEFRRACRLPTYDKPRQPDPEELRAAFLCLLEEVGEALETAYGEDSAAVERIDKVKEVLSYHYPLPNVDLANLTRELCDINVTSIGIAALCGLAEEAMPRVWDIVARANKAKAEGGYLDENGKWRKPKNWVDPGPEIERAVWRVQIDAYAGGDCDDS